MPSVEWRRSRLQNASMYSTMPIYPVDGTARDVGSGETALSYRDAQFAEVIFWGRP